MEEKILCIKSDILFREDKWNGFLSYDKEKYLTLLRENSEFRVRKDLETDSTYKQIIAQVILRYKDKYFLHRQVKKNEERLNSLCPLPLGGHIEQIDLKGGEDIFEVALDRELHEEVELGSRILKKEYLGLIYIEDEHDVNYVHLGLVYIYDLDGTKVCVKEEGLEDIGFVSLNYLKTNKEKLTYWSKIIIFHL
jgi:predicted NUDIX family phosphoesterase